MAAKRKNPKRVCSLLEAYLLLALSHAFFMVHQPLFAPDSGTEADHVAVAADDPMTGDDNQDVVFGDFRQFILKIVKKLQLGLTMPTSV